MIEDRIIDGINVNVDLWAEDTSEYDIYAYVEDERFAENVASWKSHEEVEAAQRRVAARARAYQQGLEKAKLVEGMEG